MRRMLLAVIAVAFMLPDAADAARRDERGRQQLSRPAAARVVKANPAAKPARQAAAPVRERRQAVPAQARRAPARSAVVARRMAPGRAVAANGRVLRLSRAQARARQADLRQEPVRSRGLTFVMRNAAAAAVPRNAMANCTRRNGRTLCSARNTDGVAGWQAGLPPVSYAQSDCPAGTFATLARGHDDVVRCMPL